MQIKISIANKIATAEKDIAIVCGNSDYTILFDFDSEWEAHTVKTARFNYTVQGKALYDEVVFEGNECAVPVLSNTPYVHIGVYAGDLQTTTPALVKCERSILCGSSVHAEPPEDVYMQLLNKCDEAVSTAQSVEQRADNGEFKGDKGDKGDAGVIKFIPVNTLPTENIDESAIYLVPAENTEEQNIYEEFVYIADKWESLGVVPVEIDLTDYVKKTQFADKNGKAGVVRVKASYGITSGRYDGSSPTTGDTLTIATATNGEIDAKSSQFKPITPSNLDYAVKMALTDNKIEWTEEEKKAVRILLGLEKTGNEVILENYSFSTYSGGAKLPNVSLKRDEKYLISLYITNEDNQVLTDKEVTVYDGINMPPEGEVYDGIWEPISCYAFSDTSLYLQMINGECILRVGYFDYDGNPGEYGAEGVITLIKVNE